MAPATRKPLAQRDRNIPEEIQEKLEKSVDPKTVVAGTNETDALKNFAKTDSKEILQRTESTVASQSKGQQAVTNAAVTVLPDVVNSSNKEQDDGVCAEVDTLAAMLSKTHLEASGSVSTVPRPPVRPQTAYQAFAVDTWAALKTTEGAASLKKMSSRVAEKWRNAPEKVKTAYEERTREAWQHYGDAKREHTERLAAVEEERAALEFMRKKELQEEAMAFFLKYRATVGCTSDPKKDERAKPKAARSAYNFFVTRRRGEMATDMGKMSVGDVASTIAEEWKKIQSSRKKKDKQVVSECHTLAQEDQARYQRETNEFKDWLEENEKKKATENNEYRRRALEVYRADLQDKKDAKAYRKLMTEKASQEKEERKAARIAKAAEKAAKESGPKRARNAYMFFFAEKSKESEVRAYADKENCSIATVISEMWKNCEGEELARFQEMASADRVRYAEEAGPKGGNAESSR